MERTTTEGGPPPRSEPWSRALWKSALILVLAWAGFLFVPNKLLAYLTTRVTPHARDALVTLWMLVFFAGLAWLFVAFQKSRKR